MTRTQFKTAILSMSGLDLSAVEREVLLDILDRTEPPPEQEGDFFYRVFLKISKPNSRKGREGVFYTLRKDLAFILGALRDELETLINYLAKTSRLKDFDERIGLSEDEVIRRCLRLQFYKKLPELLI